MDDLDFLNDYVDSYKNETLDLLQIGRGITFVEGFLLTSMMKELDVDLIIESGMAYGMSTEIFARCLKNVPVISIDNDRYKVFEEITKRLSKFKNVKTIYGNSFDEIPKILSNLSDWVSNLKAKKIALFIDGPKGNAAFNLGKNLMDDKRIKMISVHDIKNNEMFNKFTKKFSKNSFWSHSQNSDWIKIRDEINNHFLDLNLERGLGNDNTFKEDMEERPLGPGIAVSVINI